MVYGRRDNARRTELPPPGAVVTTAKGSTYTYLPGGKTQRFKAVEDILAEPQDLLVFVPPYDWLKHIVPPNLRGRFTELYGDNPTEYEQIILEHMLPEGSRRIHVIDENGHKIESNAEAARSGELYLILHGPNEEPRYIPVSVTPAKGWLTFDTRKFRDKGETLRETHLGNAVIGIVYADAKREHRQK